ncbi:DUF6186 family protein [Microbacter sp. GSS18]|nr:DUF6186 family protein [Microbacter sp. GSS18]
MILSPIVFALCAAALVVSAVVVHRRDADATAIAMFGAAMADRSVRLAVLMCWWWLGWHFLVAQTVDPGFGQ